MGAHWRKRAHGLSRSHMSISIQFMTYNPRALSVAERSAELTTGEEKARFVSVYSRFDASTE